MQRYVLFYNTNYEILSNSSQVTFRKVRVTFQKVSLVKMRRFCNRKDKKKKNCTEFECLQMLIYTLFIINKN